MAKSVRLTILRRRSKLIGASMSALPPRATRKRATNEVRVGLAARYSKARIYPLNSQLAPFTIRPRTRSASICTKLLIRTRPQNHRCTRRTLASSAPPTCRNLHSLFLPHRAPAAPRAHYLSTRFRALALFRGWSPERVVRSRRRRPKTCPIGDII